MEWWGWRWGERVGVELRKKEARDWQQSRNQSVNFWLQVYNLHEGFWGHLRVRELFERCPEDSEGLRTHLFGPDFWDELVPINCPKTPRWNSLTNNQILPINIWISPKRHAAELDISFLGVSHEIMTQGRVVDSRVKWQILSNVKFIFYLTPRASKINYVKIYRW